MKKVQRFGYRQIENIRYVFCTILHFQSFLGIAATLTNFTCYPNIAHKLHLDLDLTLAFASFTSAPFDVEREFAFIKSQCFRVPSRGKQVADQVKYFRISGRIAPGSPAYRRLVNQDYLIN